MITFIHICCNGDSTCTYNVELDKNYTVYEFVKEILNDKSSEWGSIGINDGVWYSRGDPYCDYKYGKLITKLPDDILSRKISKVTSYGGWGSNGLQNYITKRGIIYEKIFVLNLGSFSSTDIYWML